MTRGGHGIGAGARPAIGPSSEVLPGRGVEALR